MRILPAVPCFSHQKMLINNLGVVGLLYPLFLLTQADCEYITFMWCSCCIVIYRVTFISLSRVTTYRRSLLDSGNEVLRLASFLASQSLRFYKRLYRLQEILYRWRVMGLEPRPYITSLLNHDMWVQTGEYFIGFQFPRNNWILIKSVFYVQKWTQYCKSELCVAWHTKTDHSMYIAVYRFIHLHTLYVYVRNLQFKCF